MSKLKAIGSEKLTGQAKIDRILQIAGLRENTPNSINETHKIDYSIEMPDGNEYFIVKEKLGYVIKKGLTESTADYIEPMKNRKYYRSYSQGLKKINLIARELNEMYDNVGGLSLFGEQKKYTLKTPQAPALPQPDPMAAAVPAAPPAVPSTDLPPAPTENPMADPMGGAIPDDGDLDLGGADMPVDTPKADEDDEITFKVIQKLTGRLSQKIRVLTREDGMTSDEIKYVMNMVISSLDLDQLDDDDREDIISRLEERESDFEGVGEPNLGADDLNVPPTEEPEMNMGGGKIEAGESYNHMRRFEESKIDKLISGYFQLSETEIRRNNFKKENFKKQLRKINELTESKAQIEIAKFLLKENPDYSLIGLTNAKNLVFENSKGIVKITPKGKIINE